MQFPISLRAFPSLVAITLLLAAALRASAQTPGSLVSSFGNNGTVSTPFSSGQLFSQANGVAVQSDGKRVVVGQASGGISQAFALERFTAAGVLDSTFGIGGKVLTSIGAGDAAATSVAVRASDGEIIVAGWASDPVTGLIDFALAGYLPNGTLDSAFGGSGTGFVLTPIGSGNPPFGQEFFFTSNASAASIAIRSSDGEIILAGYATDPGDNVTTDFAIAGYTASGAVDHSFGDGVTGTLLTAMGTEDARGAGVAVESSGEIVVAGYATHGNGVQDFALAGYTSGGAVDHSFGDGATGTLITSFPRGASAATAVAIRGGDDEIVVAGQAADGSGGQDFALAGYTSTGAVDASFGGGFTGTELTQIAGCTFSYATSIAIRGSDNEIIVGGFAFANDTQDFALAAYSSNGAVDASFGGGLTGTRITPVGGGSSQGLGVAMADDGSIVEAGSVHSVQNGATSFALAGYTSVGAPDPAFNHGAPIVSPASDIGGGVGQGVAVQSDGSIIVAGYAYDFYSGYTDFELTRYTPDGALDTTFGSEGNGTVRTPVGNGNARATSLAIRSDGELVVAGYATDSFNDPSTFAIAGYTADGELDTAFGDGVTGTLLTRVGRNAAQATSVAIRSSDGEIVVAGFVYDNLSGFSDFAIVGYLPGGAQDNSFGGGVTPVGFGNSQATGVAFLSNGGIVVTGFAADPSSGFNDFAIAGYLPGGIQDYSFGDGSTGTLLTPFAYGNAQGAGVTVEANGEIVVAGFADDYISGLSDFAIAGYLPGGTQDYSFGDGSSGTLQTPVGYGGAQGLSVAQVGSGELVVAGLAVDSGSNQDFALAGFTPAGVLDTAFSGDGTGAVLTPIAGGGGIAQANAIAVESNGNIVAAGQTNDGASGDQDFAVALYQGEPPPPPGPTVTANPATLLSVSGATLNATVNDNGLPASVAFLYSTDSNFIANVTTTDTQQLDGSATDQGVSQPVTGLSAHTTYYFYATGSNSAGTTSGAVSSFTTLDTAPFAADESFETPNGIGFDLNVLGHDTDADGDPLTVASVTNVVNGTAVPGANGAAVTFTPGGGFTGSGSFDYTVNDGYLDSNTAHVTFQDTTRPVVTATNYSVSETAVGAGATVAFSATAADAVTASPVITYRVAGSLITSPHNFPEGTTTVNVSAADLAGNNGTRSFTVVVSPPPISATTVFTGAGAGRGSPVPHAHGSFVSFGQPAINDSGALAFKAQLSTNPSVIFADGTVQAQFGDFSPDGNGVVFSSFSDPAINVHGDTAFTAFLKNGDVTKTSAVGLYTTLGGTLQTVVRMGDSVPGVGTITSIHNFTLTGDTIFYVVFVGGNTCLCAWTPSGGSTLVLQTGGALDGNTVESFGALVPAAGSVGQGRSSQSMQGGELPKQKTPTPAAPKGLGQSSQGSEVVTRVYFFNHTFANYCFTPQGYSAIVAVGQASPILNGTNPIPVFSGQYFGLPIANAAGGTAFVATVKAKKLPTTKATAVFTDTGNTVATIFQIGDPVPSPGTGQMGWFADPVYNAQGDVATIASLGAVPSAINRAIIYKPSGGTAVTVAQLGDSAPGTSGAAFNMFQSLALPDNMGPVFLATLKVNGGTVTGANNTGVWAMDGSGALGLVVRTGNVESGKIIRSLAVLAVTNNSPDESRSFNASRQLVYRVNYTDGSQAIETATIP